MLATEDKKEIKKIVGSVVGKRFTKVEGGIERLDDRLDRLTASVMKMDKRLDILKDIWDFIKEHTVQLKDHEERISNLEDSPKF